MYFVVVLFRNGSNWTGSDRLYYKPQLTFDFMQFRLTGYLSPPSSSACHWSKEFQVTVNIIIIINNGHTWGLLRV